MTRKRLLIAFAAVAVVAIAAAVIVIAARLPHRDVDAAAPVTSSPIPSRSAPTDSEAIARTVADRFCQPSSTQSTWQRSLTPYLTPEAWQLYSAVAPANVPCAGIHDDGQPVGDQQTATDRAYQFTASTGGPVTVTLHRDTEAAPWLASFINAGGQE